MSSTILSSLLHSLIPLSKLNALAMHLLPGGSSSPVRHVSPFPVDSREYRHTTSAPRSLTSQVVCRLESDRHWDGNRAVALAFADSGLGRMWKC